MKSVSPMLFFIFFVFEGGPLYVFVCIMGRLMVRVLKAHQSTNSVFFMVQHQNTEKCAPIQLKQKSFATSTLYLDAFSKSHLWISCGEQREVGK